MCGRCSQMCRETLFSWRPLLPSVVVCWWGLFQFKMTSWSRQRGRKYCIKILHEMHSFHVCTSAHYIATEFLEALISNVAHFAVTLFLVWRLFTVLYFALQDIWTCDHYVVYLLAEAEHGYASMPPFISSRERESLKRKSKSKKNTSSR